MNVGIGSIFKRVYQYHLALNILNNLKQEIKLLGFIEVRFVGGEELLDDCRRAEPLVQPLVTGLLE